MIVMIRFFKDSVREIKHVVWPTRKETQKYFLLVLAILVAFGTYLFIFSNIFSTVVFGLKDMISGSSSVNTESVDTSFLDDVSVTTASGETITASGVIDASESASGSSDETQ